jgi:hypothetical protein
MHRRSVAKQPSDKEPLDCSRIGYPWCHSCRSCCLTMAWAMKTSLTLEVCCYVIVLWSSMLFWFTPSMSCARFACEEQ